MKEKIKDLITLFLLIYAMTMGFFFSYGLAWCALDLPMENWAMFLLLVLAGVTEYFYVRMVMEN